MIKLKRIGKNIYNDRLIRLKGIHNRWWQPGRANRELQNAKQKNDNLLIGRHNWNLIRDYMAEFNAMTPSTMIHDYEKTVW